MDNKFSFTQWWAEIIKVIKTPLSLMALIVLVLTAVLTTTLPMVSEKLQPLLIIGVFALLFTIITIYGKSASQPEEIKSIWSEDDLPISDSEKQCWLGKWKCKWSYRTRGGELLPYVNDIINIDEIDLKTGKITGTGTSSYEAGLTYKLVGRISNKRICHIFYSSKPPYSGLSGMSILRRTPGAEVTGWWIGAGRQGGDLGGSVIMSRPAAGDNFEIKTFEVKE